MNFRRSKNYIAKVALCGVLSICCCDNDPNPCKKLIPVSADFKIIEKFIGIDSTFAVDTVLLRHIRGAHFGRRVFFSAIEENATYTWKVGDDPRTFTEREFFLDFSDPLGEIPVTLIVTKEPNTSCFPTDNGQDTVQHTLTLLSDNEYAYAFEGIFTGANTDEPDKLFDITIVDFGPTPPVDPYDPGYYDMRIFNLPEGCGGNDITPSRFAPPLSEFSYREFYFNDTGTSSVGDCPTLYDGLGKISKDNETIVIEYTVQTMSGNTPTLTKKKFVGHRKN